MKLREQKFLTSTLLVMIITLLFTSDLGATVFWDDEMEPGNTGYTIVPDVMSYDTTVKFSGNASLKYTYGPECETMTSTCGGFMDRGFPQTANFYRRFYIMLSSDFLTSPVSTKIMRSDTTGQYST